MITTNQHNLWADQPMNQGSDTSDSSHATSEGVADRLVYPPHSATSSGGPHHPHSHHHQHHNETFLTIPRRSHNNNLNHDLVPMSTNSNSRFVVPFDGKKSLLLNKSPLGSRSILAMLGTKKICIVCVQKSFMA